MASPLQTVKSRFGSKEALVEKVAPLLDRKPDETEAELRERLLRVSNKKLLRLLAREEELRARFGSREALVDQVTQQRAGRDDADLKKKLQGHSTGRLLSLVSK
jgi:hypothetical protein